MEMTPSLEEAPCKKSRTCGEDEDTTTGYGERKTSGYVAYKHLNRKDDEEATG